MPPIAIYPGGRTLPDSTVLSLLCARWKVAGIEPVVLDRPEARIDADTAIIHVDATRRPRRYEQILRHYPRVINGRVRDISKRRISWQLVDRHSRYEGPVIVKTNANYFGIPDFPPRRTGVRAFPELWARWRDRWFVISRDIRRTHSYPIYAHIDEVPRSVWWDRRLVVEKFLPEKRDGLYCVRAWSFFGAREAVSLSMGPVPVVKRANTVRHETLKDVPDALRAARARLGFDYGKFDFVIHDGEPVLLDTNSTPNTSTMPSPRVSAIADELAAGLLDLVETGRCEPARHPQT